MTKTNRLTYNKPMIKTAENTKINNSDSAAQNGAEQAQMLNETTTKSRLFKRTSKGRIWEIDFLRGVCILLMIIDHTMFDLAMLDSWTYNFWEIDNVVFYNLNVFANFWWTHPARIAIQHLVVFIFLLLSGISCSLSRNNSKRLLKLVAAALILSVATYIIDLIAGLGVFIAFGILHIIALSLLIYMCMKKIVDNKYFYLIVGLILIVMGLKINFFDLDYIFQFDISAIIGTAQFGADSYGIVPFTGFFLLGAFVGQCLYSDKKTKLKVLSGKWSKPVEFVGRNTIFVYILHQPLIMLIVVLSAMAAGYTFF